MPAPTSRIVSTPSSSESARATRSYRSQPLIVRGGSTSTLLYDPLYQASPPFPKRLFARALAESGETAGADSLAKGAVGPKSFDLVGERVRVVGGHQQCIPSVRQQLAYSRCVRGHDRR